MQAAQLVAVRIAQIGQVELPEWVLAISRRILATGAAGGAAAGMPLVDLGRRVEGKADGRAVPVGSRLAVDRVGDHEDRAAAAVAKPALIVRPRRLAEQRIVEFPRP